MHRSLVGIIPVVVVLAGSYQPSLADEPAKAADETKLNRILDEWQRRSATRTSIDVSFTRTDKSEKWGMDESFTGRVVLLPEGRAFVQTFKPTQDGRVVETERVVWIAHALHVFRFESKSRVNLSIQPEGRGRLPAVLALPFLWHLDIPALKAHFEPALAKEDAETYVLSFIPLTETGRESLSKAFLVLDRTSYLPRRYLLISPNGKETKDYRVTEAQHDQLAPEKIMETPDPEGWRTVEWPKLLAKLYHFALFP